MAKRFDVVVGEARPGERTWSDAPRQIAILIAIGLVVAAAVYALEGSPSQASAVASGGTGAAPKIGQPAPSFELPTVSDRTFSLTAARGRPILVNFWATWCPPCRAEMPELDDAARRFASASLTIVAINFKEDTATAERYLRTLNVAFTPLLDIDGAVARAYGINALPTTFAIDREGVVRGVHIGPMNRATLDGLVQKIA
ncbi:MAG: TlpA family protein disulfide reductase [Chloroflexota bacterium]|nr:MAG: TlpA family protein disulfide reductase [Chloroflexota bacterium]